MAEGRFAGKVAVVTGAGGTLCSAVAVDLARQGAAVALLGRTLSKLEDVAQTITAAGGRALPLSVDVTDAAAVAAAEATIRDQIGPCDLLVNGAGGNHPEAVTTLNHFGPEELADTPPEGIRGFFNLNTDRLDDVIRLNTTGSLLPCQAFGRGMAERGGGAILNFASMNTYRPLTRNAAYAMSKAAIANFTQWLAAYLAPAGIRVNAVAPGFFVNERSKKILMTPDGGLSPRGEQVMAHTPMKRFGEAQDLLGCVAWLLDDTQSAFVTGVTIPVDGGFLSSAGV